VLLIVSVLYVFGDTGVVGVVATVGIVGAFCVGVDNTSNFDFRLN